MSHQDRRTPLPAEYQFPTHGVDCDCPPCRNRVMYRVEVVDPVGGCFTMSRIEPTTDREFGWIAVGDGELRDLWGV